MEITSLSQEELEKFRSAAQPQIVEWLKKQVDPKWVVKVQDSVNAASQVQ